MWRKLRFRDEYIPLILTGKKTSTIRLERKYNRGDTVYLVSQTTGRIFGKAKITKITEKRLDELNDEDAWRDGFRDKYTLIEALKSIYGNLPNDTKLYIIEFKLKR